MTTVLVTGASGLVGSHIINSLSKHFRWLTPNLDRLDITNQSQTAGFVNSHDFDCCLHLAAYTNVEQAEVNKALCHKINVIGTKNLFKAIKQKNKPFILISTDFVFDGKQEQYNESSVPHPLNYYGQTKYEAEQIVNGQGMIIRLSYPYGSSGNVKPDFVQVIKQRLQNGQTVQGITDSTFTPTLLDDIAKGIHYFLTHYQPKIFHLNGSESLSPYSAFKQIATVFDLNSQLILPTTFDQYSQKKVNRPRLGTMTTLYPFIQTYSFADGLQVVKRLYS